MNSESQQEQLSSNGEDSCVQNKSDSPEKVQSQKIEIHQGEAVEDNTMAAAVEITPPGAVGPANDSPSSIKDRLKQFDTMSQQVDERQSIEKRVKEEAARRRQEREEQQKRQEEERRTRECKLEDEKKRKENRAAFQSKFSAIFEKSPE